MIIGLNAWQTSAEQFPGMNQSNLDEVVVEAWRAFEYASDLRSPSFPQHHPDIVCTGRRLPLFQDACSHAESDSDPSLREFPSESPFQRFPLAECVTIDERSISDLDALYGV